MAKINIHQDKCKGCFLCIAFCPKGLIKASNKLNKRGLNYAEFSRKAQRSGGGIPPPLAGGKDSSECAGCALCAIICPDCCITVYK